MGHHCWERVSSDWTRKYTKSVLVTTVCGYASWKISTDYTHWSSHIKAIITKTKLQTVKGSKATSNLKTTGRIYWWICEFYPGTNTQINRHNDTEHFVHSLELKTSLRGEVKLGFVMLTFSPNLWKYEATKKLAHTLWHIHTRRPGRSQ